MEKKKMRTQYYLVIWSGRNTYGRLVSEIIPCNCTMGRYTNRKHEAGCLLLEHPTAVHIPIRKGETISDVSEMLYKLTRISEK